MNLRQRVWLVKIQIITCLSFSCALSACGHIVGYYEKAYTGGMPRDQIAILVPNTWYEGYSADINGVNGVPKTRLSAIELLPGTYDICVSYFSYNSKNGTRLSSNGCVNTMFVAEPGHVYIPEVVIDKAPGLQQQSNGGGNFIREVDLPMHTTIRDITNEQSPRKKIIEEHIASYR